MTLITLFIAIFHVFIGIKTAILLTNEFNIYIGFLGFFIITYISYILLKFSFKFFLLLSEYKDKVIKVNRKILIKKENMITDLGLAISALIALVIANNYIVLMGYISFLVSFLFIYFLYFLCLYFCYNLNICKRKSTTTKEKS